MIAGLFLYATRELAGLYDWMGKKAAAKRLRGNWADMKKVVEGAGWDGEWFVRAYDAAGKPVGSKVCKEGRIFIESQAWCVLGGAGAEDGRARQALESVHKHLYTSDGIVLQTPPYATYHKELGEVSSYPPGYKENAGIFSHNNTWIHLAWCEQGEGDRALEYYRSICPAAHQDRHDTYRAEPYVYAQMIAGRDSANPGEAKNSWLTGTAAWTFVVVSQGILGIRPDYAGLRVQPCIPKGWRGFTVKRTFRGAIYEITVKNTGGSGFGTKRVTVDGKIMADGVVPVFKAGTKHRVEVELI
jgi:cellobiose phosphorylase